MAVSATRNEQLRRYVENRHIDHIPAGARHSLSNVSERELVIYEIYAPAGPAFDFIAEV